MLIRKLLIQIFGFPAYLRIISYIFIQTYLKRWYLGEHHQVRFLGHLVQPTHTCIDIGANLGYFSLPLSKLVGENGKVYSVEPVKQFREVLQGNVRRFQASNIEVMPYALGEVDGQEVEMATPVVDGVVRHGRTEVVEAEKQGDIHATHKATMRTPQSLFAQIPEIHFIKCDVEGYETKILPQLMPLIKKHLPILEIEIDPLDHKKEIIALLQPIGYHVFFLGKEGILHPFSLENKDSLKEIELYFLQTEHIQKIKPRLMNKIT